MKGVSSGSIYLKGRLRPPPVWQDEEEEEDGGDGGAARLKKPREPKPRRNNGILRIRPGAFSGPGMMEEFQVRGLKCLG